MSILDTSMVSFAAAAVLPGRRRSTRKTDPAPAQIIPTPSNADGRQDHDDAREKRPKTYTQAGLPGAAEEHALDLYG